jgi:hypothetical protein
VRRDVVAGVRATRAGPRELYRGDSLLAHRVKVEAIIEADRDGGGSRVGRDVDVGQEDGCSGLGCGCCDDRRIGPDLGGCVWMMRLREATRVS